MLSLAVALSCVLAVAANGQAKVQMEPSVHTFSSSKWDLVKDAPADAIVNAAFALKHDQEKMDKFTALLLELSTPRTAKYGKWLTPKEIMDMTSPSESSVKLVTDYLDSFGVNTYRVSTYNDVVFVNMTVSAAEKMFDTEFAVFQSRVERKASILRITKPYYLPVDLAEVVSIVDDIMRFPSVKEPIIVLPNNATAGTDPEFQTCGTKCSGFTTPDVLQTAYSFSELTKSTTGNSVSVAEFQFQYYDQTDIDNFEAACGTTVEVTTTIGGNNEAPCLKGGCVEALLDIQYIGAGSWPIPLTVYYQQQYSLLDWVNGLIALPNPPLVNSVSYGNDEVQQTSSAYMQTVNTQFQKAGALGLSILFAAGDQGVWGRTGYSPTGTFNPDFPAGSPYVTAVGGTNFQTKSVIGPETTWDCGGGGFSEEFSQPSWQASQVNAYLANAAAQGVLPDAKLFNAGGRGYPDVSALGGQTNAYCVAYNGGSFAGVAGTSASCPVVSGIIAQLNDLRLAKGLTSLGWLNPFLYDAGTASCYQDINDGSLNNCYKGATGFAALNGWDPATGLGSLNYQCLATLM